MQKATILILNSILCSLLIFRTYTAIVPIGASPLPYLLARMPMSDIVSPDGLEVVNFYLNDAGAAHGGNHWSWLVKCNLILGCRVVSEGYVVPLDDFKTTTLSPRWLSESKLELNYIDSRYGGKTEIRTIDL